VAADRYGWTYVGGVFESFADHGYSADETWFVRAKESERIQGPRLGLLGYLRGEFSPGMLHPNARGHEVIADHLYRSFARKGDGRIAGGTPNAVPGPETLGESTP
jgi:hypothetical protein